MQRRSLLLSLAALLSTLPIVAQTPDMIWMKGGGHFGGVAIGPSADGSLIASADRTGRLIVRDAVTAVTVARRRYESSSFVEVGYTRGGEIWLATDDSLHVWTLDPDSHRSSPIATPVAAFLSDEERAVVAVGSDGTVRTYALPSGELIATDVVGAAGIREAYGLDDGTIVAYFDGNDIRAYDLRADSLLPLAIPQPQIWPVRPDLIAATRDSDLVVAPTSFEGVGFWSARSGVLVDSISFRILYDAERQRQYFNPSGMLDGTPCYAGATLSSAGDTLVLHMDIDAQIHYVDRIAKRVIRAFPDGHAHTGTWVTDMHGEGMESSLALAADARHLFMVSAESAADYAYGRTDISIARYTPSTDSATVVRSELLPIQYAVSDVAASADGRSAVALAGPLRTEWSLPDGAITGIGRSMTPTYFATVLSPDGRHSMSYSSLWLQHGVEIATVVDGMGALRDGRTLSSPHNMAVSPAARYALMGSRLYTSSSDYSTLPLPGHRGAIFSHDTVRLAIWTRDSVFIWNCAESLLEHVIHVSGSTTVGAFSRTGRSFAIGLESGEIVVVDVPTGAERARLSGHDSVITAIGFSHGDAFLVSASRDATMRSWAIATRVNDYTYTGYPGIMLAVDATDDGRMIFSGTDEGAVILWHGRGAIASSDEPVADASRACTLHVAHGRLVVAVDGAKEVSVDLFDVTGRLVARGDVAQESVTLDVGELSAGIYVARVDTGDDVSFRTIAVDRGR
jgi:WD40 repeat protein